jgi:hypothetical protein
MGAAGPGALANVNGGTMRLVGSHITDNSGGLDVGGLGVVGGWVSIANTTFAGNLQTTLVRFEWRG